MTFPNRRKLVCTLYIFPLRKFTRLMSFRNPRRLRDFDPQLFRYTIFKVKHWEMAFLSMLLLFSAMLKKWPQSKWGVTQESFLLQDSFLSRGFIQISHHNCNTWRRAYYTMYLWAFHFLNKGQNENFVEKCVPGRLFFWRLTNFTRFLKIRWSLIHEWILKNPV